MNTKAIIVQENFNKSQKEVWEAITEVNQMVQWFFDNIPVFKAEVGFETSFNVSTGERNFLHLWKIIEVIPNQKIVYDWSYKDYEGQGIVTFELNQEINQTKLTLTCEGMETFTADIPEFKRASCEGGWNYFIKEQLKNYLAQ